MTDEDAAQAGRMLAEEAAHEDALEGDWDGSIEEAAMLVVHEDPREVQRLAGVVHAAAQARWAEMVRSGRRSDGLGIVIAAGCVVGAGDKVTYVDITSGQPTGDAWRIQRIHSNGVLIQRVYPPTAAFGCPLVEVFVPNGMRCNLGPWRPN